MVTEARTDLGGLLEDEAACKARGTCPRLAIRGHFHEPNAMTIETWRAQGLYARGIDRRVMFVCESPSGAAKGVAPQFFVGGIGGYRTWAGLNHRTKPFAEMKKKYGFEHCFITNTVKCGCPAGVKAKPTNIEISNCAPFLRREIDFVRPAVVACLGKKAFEWSAPVIADIEAISRPPQIYVTHYSAHEPPYGLQQIWVEQFAAIKSAIRARGMPDDQPVFLSV